MCDLFFVKCKIEFSILLAPFFRLYQPRYLSVSFLLLNVVKKIPLHPFRLAFILSMWYFPAYLYNCRTYSSFQTSLPLTMLTLISPVLHPAHLSVYSFNRAFGQLNKTKASFKFLPLTITCSSFNSRPPLHRLPRTECWWINFFLLLSLDEAHAKTVPY